MHALRLLTVGFVLAVSTACGPKTDKSRFVSAKLTRGNVVLFTYADVAYRLQHQGGIAFGGSTAKYVQDVNYVGTFDMATNAVGILHESENDDFRGDQGHFTVTHVNGGVALLTQAGTLLNGGSEARYWLVDLRKPAMARMDFVAELAEHGRAVSEMHLVGDSGAILFHSESTAEKLKHSAWRRTSDVVPELWLRYPDGEYVKIGATRHIEKVEPTRVVYFVPEPRATFAFDVETRRTTQLARYRHPPFQDITAGVTVPPGGKSLEYGVKTNDQWTYTTLPVTRAMIR